MDFKRQDYKASGRTANIHRKVDGFFVNALYDSSLAIEECKKIRGMSEYPGREWHVLSTFEGFEDRACKRLSAQEIPAYFPRIRCSEQQWGSGRSKAFFPEIIFAALNDENKQKLLHNLFIESIEEVKTPQQQTTIQADMNFMAFAERLNCFYPFRTTEHIPYPPVGGIPGRDFVELKGKDECGYILLLSKKNADQVYFKFDSINRKIFFEISKNVFVKILNIK